MAHLARSLDQVEADLRAQGAKIAQPLPQQTPVKTAVQAGGTTKIVPPQVKPQEPLTQVRAERSGEPESDPKAEPEEGDVRACISARNGTRTKHPQGIHPGLA